MEEHLEFKHACKFCSKSFPCGRSLGGHMRSHIANVSAETTEEKLATRKLKLSSLDNNGGSGSGSYAKGVVDMGSEAGTNNNNTGYVLRENRKKTWRLADLSEDTLVSDKFCKECGKGFHSWKALFGHMKCHSEKERVSNSLDDQDSWTNNNATQQKQLVMDSQSDNEATVPNRRRRSKRRTRYMITAAAATSSSLSEVEQEQEEVAVSLMMLSRDVGPWSGLNSVAESSDNNSPYFEARSSVGTKIEGKKPIPNGSDSEIALAAKLIKQSDKKREFGNMVSSNINLKGKSSELLPSELLGKGFRINKTSVFIKNQKAEESELDYVSALEDSEGGQLKKKKKKNGVNGTELVLSKPATNKYTSIKTKFFDSELKSNSLKNCRVNKPSEAEFSKNSHKRGKFECATCNKVFHSYQALGGHRASHKKIKGNYLASRHDQSSENSIETDLSPDPTTESKLMKNNDNEYVAEVGHELDAGFNNEAATVTESKKSKEHECPICLKVFPSGQALGGHKRSHLGGGCESRNCHTVVLQEPVPEIRNFLDLNLPAVTEEESNSHADSYTPWWVVEGNHKQEALVGLMSS